MKFIQTETVYDNATIHRSAVSLAAVAETFDNRIQPSLQASTMADVYPIENVCSIVKTKVYAKKVTNVPSLKRAITSAWNEIDRDKELCKKLMASIPKRLACVIAKEGAQISKNDY